MSRQWNGSSGSPIKLRTNAPRQTEEQRYPKRQRPIPFDDEDDNPDAWTVEKPRSTARRYDISTTQFRAKPTRVINHRHFDRWTLVILLCTAIIVMVLGWFIFSTIAEWWTNTTDDWKYGSIRTYQTDQFVGQGDSPDHPDHFIVVNTHGQVIVTQLNPQHPDLDHIYNITTTSDPKTPVSLNFRPTGTTWAMYVIVGDTNPYSVELVSNGKQFVSPH